MGFNDEPCSGFSRTFRVANVLELAWMTVAAIALSALRLVAPKRA